MSARFTDDEVGKRVVNANGEEVGIVSAVEHGTAHVDPDPGITDSIKASLGWGGRDEDTYPLQEESIDAITDDEIRLSSDLSAGGTDAGTGTTGGDVGGGMTGGQDESGLGRDDESGMRRDDESGMGRDTDTRGSDDDRSL